MTLRTFAELALASGGLEPEMYSLNEVKQIGDSASMGTFENGAESGLPIDKGLLFTSGKAVDAVGPNTKPNTSTAWDNPGHVLLDNITGANTKDASGLGIYLTAERDAVIAYDALFGSEEFDEWVGSVFNDGAGIFVAELKSRDQVFDLGAVQNVLRQPSGGKMTINELANPQSDGSVSGKFYNPNPVCGDMNWEYDGSSELTRTESVVLEAGNHYYIGIMVADGVDSVYDSSLALSLNPLEDGQGDKSFKTLEKTVATPFTGKGFAGMDLSGMPSSGKKETSRLFVDALANREPSQVADAKMDNSAGSSRMVARASFKSLSRDFASQATFSEKEQLSKEMQLETPGQLADKAFADLFSL